MARICRLSPDGRRAATEHLYVGLTLWNGQSGTVIAEPEPQGVDSCAFSADGRLMAAFSRQVGEGQLEVWDAGTGGRLVTVGGLRPIGTKVEFSKDGQLVIAVGDEIRLYRADTGAIVWRMAGCMAVMTPDSRRIIGVENIAVERGTGVGRRVRLTGTDIETRATLYSVVGHEDGIIDCAVSPDGRRLATASWDGTLGLWDAGTGSQLASLQGHGAEVFSCTFDRSGSRIVSAARNATIIVWDGRTGTRIARLEGHTRDLQRVAFDPDGCHVISGAKDNTIRVWDSLTGAECALLPAIGLQLLDVAGDCGRIAFTASSGLLELAEIRGLTHSPV
jgi:WD40 repeat protein